MFFSFDGIDGAGKSTQIDRLVAWLREQGHEACVCRDPGSTELGEKLRDLLLEDSDVPIHVRSEMLIYMAARAQLVEQVIRPALHRGQVVVCDRFLLANIVYQGHAGGVDLEAVRQTALISTGGITPDCVFLFDLPAKTALSRLNRPFDRMEQKGPTYLEVVRQGFLKEAQYESHRVTVIDATTNEEAIAAQIRETASCLLASAEAGDRGAP